ncbi:MAG TPA: DUF4235 domain-containing protein [Candidatus Luteococcus avicola]|uniref:DUF4235 domain-containing protein n=1 Tax=Luteococcus sanguinis TaxID=174038 RepID=A0ABW1X2Y4_9ACTN|nr:DUF4235 domain-containing protein [Candidatus Luteococcus avicola]
MAAPATQKITFKVYALALGAVATFASRKLVEAGWRVATGRPAPTKDDQETSSTQAAMWAVASGVGIAVSQAFVNKYLAERFETLTGEPAPEKMRQVKIKA